VLNKTVGFIALVRFLRTCVNTLRDIKEYDSSTIISSADYSFLLKSTKIRGEFFYSIDAVSKSSGEVFKELDKTLLIEYRDSEGKYNKDEVLDAMNSSCLN
jgi:hypothetical protein